MARLIARIDVGPFVAIDFHGDEMLVDDARRSPDFRRLSRSMTWHQWHHTAPMSSSMGLSSAFSAGESLVAPFIPIDGLMRRGSQVRAGGIFQAIFSGV